MLAEGGEGKVFEVAGQPGVLFKEYRRPLELREMASLVAWPATSAIERHMAERVRRATAWPTAVVSASGREMDTAVGVLIPRAPRRFSIRHRDGIARLATLSYLTADPERRSASYGLELPPQGAAVRFGLVYALARVLEAFESAAPSVSHGDLSAKNVLWSMQRGPEVFLLDCDNAARFDLAKAPLDGSRRRRAMTPNWDDPAVAPGENPGPGADRYSLGLVCLRLIGAGHFPVQKRQRAGEDMAIDLALPAAALKAASLGPDGRFWSVVADSLSISAGENRPPASTWCDALEEVLVDLGALDVIEAVRANGGHPRSSERSQDFAGAGRNLQPGDVLTSLPPPPSIGQDGIAEQDGPRRDPQRRQGGRITVRPALARPRPSWKPDGPSRAPSGITSTKSDPSPTSATHPTRSTGSSISLRSQIAVGLAAALRVWLGLHRRTARLLLSRGDRGRGVRRLIGCFALDVIVMSVSLLLVAMVVSPFLGI